MRLRLLLCVTVVLALVTGCGVGTVPVQPAATEGTGMGGFVMINSQSAQWVQQHPDDPRADAIREGIAKYPVAEWLAGDPTADLRNLTDSKNKALALDATAVLVLYNIPGRDDGVSTPSTLSDAAYREWVDRLAEALGNTRSVVVVEPDALWFTDRQFPDPALRQLRLDQIRYAAARFAEQPAVRVYVDAGTSSGSVTPQRMGDLLAMVGAGDRIGFAVNTSSFSPEPAISQYAAAIQARLQSKGVANPRFLVDTGRNGNPQWDYQWCNPDGRRVGTPPAVVDAPDGRDFNLWIKEPGTSDGNCGNGVGTSGGQFMPDVAMRQLGL